MDSILQATRECYITGATDGLHKHHIYFGNPNRRISEANGFWVWLRWDWTTVPTTASTSTGIWTCG